MVFLMAKRLFYAVAKSWPEVNGLELYASLISKNGGFNVKIQGGGFMSDDGKWKVGVENPLEESAEEIFLFEKNVSFERAADVYRRLN